MPDALNSREGPQAREPVKCLSGRSYGERLAKEAFDWQLQEAGIKTLSDHNSCGRGSLSLHTWRCQGPRKPSSCATFTLNSHWGRAATGKKKSCVYGHRVTLVVSDSATL